ncbi:MAG: hypothetical protein RLZZ480_272 [Candidatus Parcubacteria bacterium]|jgi:hypothetical protein
MHVLGQVVEGSIITAVHDVCVGGAELREILVSVTYQQGSHDVVVLNLRTRKLSRLPIVEGKGARRVAMLLNNISTPARFAFQTSAVLEVHVHVAANRYLTVREERNGLKRPGWLAVGDGQVK